MIIEFFVDVFVLFFDALISTVSVVTIPVDICNSLAIFGAYGSWVVGSDLLMLFSTCVFSWTGIKFSVGIVLFFWRLLPFT